MAAIHDGRRLRTKAHVEESTSRSRSSQRRVVRRGGRRTIARRSDVLVVDGRLEWRVVVVRWSNRRSAARALRFGVALCNVTRERRAGSRCELPDFPCSRGGAALATSIGSRCFRSSGPTDPPKWSAWSTRTFQWATTAALAVLREKAADMGADAVIGVDFQHGEGHDGEPIHLSGLAIRYLNGRIATD